MNDFDLSQIEWLTLSPDEVADENTIDSQPAISA